MVSWIQSIAIPPGLSRPQRITSASKKWAYITFSMRTETVYISYDKRVSENGIVYNNYYRRFVELFNKRFATSHFISMVKGCLLHSQPLNWSTTPCQCLWLLVQYTLQSRTHGSISGRCKRLFSSPQLPDWQWESIHGTTKITSYFEEGCSWVTGSHFACQEMSCLLWNLNVHYHVHSCPLHNVRIWQENPIHILTTCFFHLS
jgi:hypothetical protein